MKRTLHNAAAAFVLLSILVLQSANACLWDRDTLAMEAENFPGLTEIITGRFDRFPPLYYEMRLERVSKELESNPDNLGLYDDAGVACDRLGRPDEAIEWMAKKRAMLDTLAPLGGNLSNHEYRYLANLGTFHIHRWLKNGADRSDMFDVERSRELIAAAIELNPDAHFGRERYQLLAIEWIQKLEYGNVSVSLLSAVPGYQDKNWPYSGYFKKQLQVLGFPDTVEGLSGLLVLGNAWESIDVLHALGQALAEHEHATLIYLCSLRIHELIADGKRSLHPHFPYDQYSDESLEHVDVVVQAHELRTSYYPAARAEVESWQNQRNLYLTKQLDAGYHPDTDLNFWSGWHESTSPVSLPGNGFFARRPLLLPALMSFGTLALLTAILIAGAAWIFKRLRRKPA